MKGKNNPLAKHEASKNAKIYSKNYMAYTNNRKKMKKT